MEAGQPEDILAAVDGWLRSHGLPAELHQAARGAARWLQHCAPADGSRHSKIMVCKDLTLWLSSIDDHDCNKSGQEQFFADCLRILDRGHGGRPDEPSGSLRAYGEIIRDVQAISGDTSRYLSGRKRYIHCIAARNRRDHRFSFDEYLGLRRTTIFVDQWMELFAILEGFQLTEEDRLSPGLQRAAESAIDSSVFLNEVYSVDRDKGFVPNLVHLRQRERGCSRGEAVAEVNQMYDDAVRRYAAAAQDLRSRPLPDRVLRYLDYLDHTIRGSRSAYRDNQSRYAPPLL